MTIIRSKKHAGGFTLIELLVVIAIIGILATLILVALGQARTKAQETRIQSDLNQVRVKAEVLYDTNNNYDLVNVSGPDPDIIRLNGDIKLRNGGTDMIVNRDNPTGAQRYCAYSPLGPGAAAQRACVDSTGNFLIAPSSGITCTTTDFTCGP